MARIINAKQLGHSLPEVVRRVAGGETYLVLYRSRPAFRVVPIGDADLERAVGDLKDDPLYRAPAVGRSRHGLSSQNHDAALYGMRKQ